MENRPESVTDVRVRLYREALDQLREENELAEREAAATKEPEEQSAKEPNDETGEAREPIDEDSEAPAAPGTTGTTRAQFLGRS